MAKKLIFFIKGQINLFLNHISFRSGYEDDEEDYHHQNDYGYDNDNVSMMMMIMMMC